MGTMGGDLAHPRHREPELSAWLSWPWCPRRCCSCCSLQRPPCLVAPRGCASPPSVDEGSGVVADSNPLIAAADLVVNDDSGSQISAVRSLLEANADLSGMLP
nr:hypothetical protein Itr_chr03CG22640 [Ipomoea trifida]